MVNCGDSCELDWCYVDSSCGLADVTQSSYNAAISYSYQNCGSVDDNSPATSPVVDSSAAESEGRPRNVIAINMSFDVDLKRPERIFVSPTETTEPATPDDD